LCAGFIVAKQLALAGGGASGVLLDGSQSHVPINAFGRVSVITVEVPIGHARPARLAPVAIGLALVFSILMGADRRLRTPGR